MYIPTFIPFKCVYPHFCHLKEVVTYLFTKGKWYIFVFYHMAYLTFHCKSKEHNPVKQQNWPEYRDIKHRKERQNKGHTEGFCQSIPVK